MFERFTDRARSVMAIAHREAVRLHHQYVGTEHILLALIRCGSGTGNSVLGRLVGDLPALAVEVERFIKRGTETIETGTLPQTRQAKSVVEFAIKEARLANRAYVGTEHLLLGLLHVPDGIAGNVLTLRGLSLPQVRQAALDITESGEGAAD